MSEASKPYVGGQAVIEGVMMRSPRAMAVAVRRGDGSIVLREDPWNSIFDRLGFLRWPMLRGTVILVESIFNGIQALNFSAMQAEITSGDPDAEDAEPKRVADSPQSKAAVAFTMVLAFFMALGLFVGLPHLLAWGAGALTNQSFGLDSFAFHALDGLFKILIFVGYIGGISLLPEIRRVFEYHGAEHKAINAYEHGEELTVENARKWTTFHPRCGTSFVLFVLVLSIFMFAAIFPFIPRVAEMDLLNHFAMIGIKIPLMLPLAGFAYEINRYAAKHPEQFWVQALVAPGRLMQSMTTREPDEKQLEIALAAMRAALRAEARLQVSTPERAPALSDAPDQRGQVTVFRDFGEISRLISDAP